MRLTREPLTNDVMILPDCPCHEPTPLIQSSRCMPFNNILREGVDGDDGSRGYFVYGRVHQRRSDTAVPVLGSDS